MDEAQQGLHDAAGAVAAHVEESFVPPVRAMRARMQCRKLYVFLPLSSAEVLAMARRPGIPVLQVHMCPDVVTECDSA